MDHFPNSGVDHLSRFLGGSSFRFLGWFIFWIQGWFILWWEFSLCWDGAAWGFDGDVAGLAGGVGEEAAPGPVFGPCDEFSCDRVAVRVL